MVLMLRLRCGQKRQRSRRGTAAEARAQRQGQKTPCDSLQTEQDQRATCVVIKAAALHRLPKSVAS
eukprot:2811303-Pleurochrysis_carterae.AAC.1